MVLVHVVIQTGLLPVTVQKIQEVIPTSLVNTNLIYLHPFYVNLEIVVRIPIVT